jgi:hypothetical protein
MTQLPTWSYQGTVPLTGDLSVLEAALHTGRVEAAELGYTAEPRTIDTEEAMWREPEAGPDSESLSAEQARAAGVEFVPTVLRFRMEWSGEGAADGDSVETATVVADSVTADPVEEIDSH